MAFTMWSVKPSAISIVTAGGVANSGAVEAIAPVTGAAHEYAVVTRERTTATNTNAYDGLRPEWHVAVATVSRVARGGWVVSAWQPEN